MRLIFNFGFTFAMLKTAASAETHYYEALGAPIIQAGALTKITKIGIGLDSSDMANQWITQEVTAVFENIVAG